MFRRIIVICIGTLILTTGIARASIRITEIAWMGTAESQFGEWFELYNDGVDDVNLTGWKLYEDSGAQLVFTLTKTILSKSYLLVERTTSSSPDPVPNINDESGPFGGSGFSNTGEDLVLKDSQDATIQTLSFSSGWPAGDANTKQTMQWDGSKWVTAVATPKAGLQGGGDTPINPEVKSSGTAWSIPKTEPKIQLSIPDLVYTSVSSEYSAKTFLEYGEAYSGVFLWNMGDGTTYKADTPSPVKHTYQYAGTYTISFVYYKTPYDIKPFLSSSVEKKVINPSISLSIVPDKGFQFTNSDSSPVDISGWIIVLPNQNLELPPFSIIGSKKTIIMPFSNFGLSDTPTKASLQTPERKTIISDEGTKNVKGSSVIFKDNPKTVFVDTLASVSTPEVNNVEQKTKNHTKVFIFGGVLLVVIALFLFIENSMVKKQE